MSAADLRHGWYGTYTNHGCRCDDCRTAWREYRRATRGDRITGPARHNRRWHGSQPKDNAS